MAYYTDLGAVTDPGYIALKAVLNSTAADLRAALGYLADGNLTAAAQIHNRGADRFNSYLSDPALAEVAENLKLLSLHDTFMAKFAATGSKLAVHAFQAPGTAPSVFTPTGKGAESTGQAAPVIKLAEPSKPEKKFPFIPLAIGAAALYFAMR